jgi:hypothetical protein
MQRDETALTCVLYLELGPSCARKPSLLVLDPMDENASLSLDLPLLDLDLMLAAAFDAMPVLEVAALCETHAAAMASTISKGAAGSRVMDMLAAY